MLFCNGTDKVSKFDLSDIFRIADFYLVLNCEKSVIRFLIQESK